MTTQRLVLLFALVAVMGGCSIWYMKVILPSTSAIDEVSVTTPAVPTKVVAPKETEVKKVSVNSKAATPTGPSGVDKVSDALGLTVIADALAAIASSAETADNAYDDSALQADVTGAEPASLTTAYGI